MIDTHYVLIDGIRNMRAKSGRNIAFATISGRDCNGLMFNNMEAAIFDNDLLSFCRKINAENRFAAVHIEAGERGNTIRDAEILSLPDPIEDIGGGDITIREWIKRRRDAFGFYFDWHPIDFIISPPLSRGVHPATLGRVHTVPWLSPCLRVEAGGYTMLGGFSSKYESTMAVAFATKYGLDAKVAPCHKWMYDEIVKRMESKAAAKQRQSQGFIELF